MKRLLCILSSMNYGGAETFLMKLYRQVNKDKYLINGAWHYPSDHNPVVADILFR